VFLSAKFADKKQPKQEGKVPEIRKNFNFEGVMTFFGKFLETHRHNPQNFKYREYASAGGENGHLPPWQLEIKRKNF